jgi:hypothetical protein
MISDKKDAFSGRTRKFVHLPLYFINCQANPLAVEVFNQCFRAGGFFKGNIPAIGTIFCEKRLRITPDAPSRAS